MGLGIQTAQERGERIVIIAEFSKPCEEITVTLTYKEVLEITRLLEGVGKLNTKHSNLEKQFEALRLIAGGDPMDNIFLIGDEVKES